MGNYERAQKARGLKIGAKTVYCIYCNNPLSFRDGRPFCRKCKLFNIIFEDSEYKERDTMGNYIPGPWRIKWRWKNKQLKRALNIYKY